jgi:fructose-specific phosphotransferase system IIC component
MTCIGGAEMSSIRVQEVSRTFSQAVRDLTIPIIGKLIVTASVVYTTNAVIQKINERLERDPSTLEKVCYVMSGVTLGLCTSGFISV